MFASIHGGKDLGSSEDDAGIGADMATLSGNVHADPLLVDPADGDFRLSMSSPAIDAGLDVPECAHDIEGNNRPAGAHWDLGAYELGSSMGGASSSGSGQGAGGPSGNDAAGPSSEASAGPGGQAAIPDGDADSGSSAAGCCVPAAPSGDLALVVLALLAAMPPAQRSPRPRAGRLIVAGDKSTAL